MQDYQLEKTILTLWKKKKLPSTFLIFNFIHSTNSTLGNVSSSTVTCQATGGLTDNRCMSTVLWFGTQVTEIKTSGCCCIKLSFALLIIVASAQKMPAFHSKLWDSLAMGVETTTAPVSATLRKKVQSTSTFCFVDITLDSMANSASKAQMPFSPSCYALLCNTYTLLPYLKTLLCNTYTLLLYLQPFLCNTYTLLLYLQNTPMQYLYPPAIPATTSMPYLYLPATPANTPMPYLYPPATPANTPMQYLYPPANYGFDSFRYLPEQDGWNMMASVWPTTDLQNTRTPTILNFKTASLKCNHTELQQESRVSSNFSSFTNPMHVTYALTLQAKVNRKQQQCW